MVHSKELLADQLLANANDPSWYVPFSESVEKLTEEQAFWKPTEDSNSIAEIVQHLLYWNQHGKQGTKNPTSMQCLLLETMTRALSFRKTVLLKI